MSEKDFSDYNKLFAQTFSKDATTTTSQGAPTTPLPQQQPQSQPQGTVTSVSSQPLERKTSVNRKLTPNPLFSNYDDTDSKQFKPTVQKPKTPPTSEKTNTETTDSTSSNQGKNSRPSSRGGNFQSMFPYRKL